MIDYFFAKDKPKAKLKIICIKCGQRMIGTTLPRHWRRAHKYETYKTYKGRSIVG